MSEETKFQRVRGYQVHDPMRPAEVVFIQFVEFCDQARAIAKRFNLVATPTQEGLRIAPMNRLQDGGIRAMCEMHFVEQGAPESRWRSFNLMLWDGLTESELMEAIKTELELFESIKRAHAIRQSVVSKDDE